MTASFIRGLELSESVEQYKEAEFLPSSLVSREWMKEAMELQKDHNFAPSTGARLYAYTASVFADVLERTDDASEASRATALLLSHLLPDDRARIAQVLSGIHGFIPSISAEGNAIVRDYIARADTDGYDQKWSTQMIPQGSDKWYLRGGGATDGGAMSGMWRPWILDAPLDTTVPAPPELGGVADMLELEKVKLATEFRRPSHISAIFTWQGSAGFIKGRNKDNITPAGVWQNILFVEKGGDLDEASYARAQKILAQSVADSFIYTWQVKYEHYTQRPSMRMDRLAVALADPPFPSYISGHSTISATAAEVLTALFPEKSQVWKQNAKDARVSRLLAGIHFDTDNAAGENYGARMGRAIVDKLGIASRPTFDELQPYTPNIAVIDSLQLLGIRTYRFFAMSEWSRAYKNLLAYFSRIRFEDVAIRTGVPVDQSTSVAWGDYNNDGHLDLLTSFALFRGTKDGVFVNANDESGLKAIFSEPWRGFFVDIDDDGCEDVQFLSSSRHEIWLYKNNCHGAFYSMGALPGAPASDLNGTAWADYDHDGDLDLYVAYWYAAVPNPEFRYTPNALWRNNGNWKFSEVAASAGVTGRAECENAKALPKNRPAKNAYQPIWFDFNNDGYDDLFVATDTGISPLYRNNKDGTFEDVTFSSGLCVLGTGMGVAIADVDGNGYSDLYVTNTGYNYLWMNRGDGTFTEEAAARGVANRGQGWGTHFEDFDNDGDADLYVVNGTTDEALVDTEHEVNFDNLDELYENHGDGHFAPVGAHAGIGGTAFKQASAAADYDNDGRVDVYVAALAHAQGVYNNLYRNTTTGGNDWIQVRLVGTKSNSDGIGARISVTANGRTQIRSVLQSGSFYGQDSRWLHFGLGNVRGPVTITVKWPSGAIQTLDTTELKRLVTVEESV